MNRPTAQRNIEADWHGLRCTGTAVVGAWEGDPSIPRGTRTIPPHMEDIAVYTSIDIEITDYLTEDAIEYVEDALLQAAFEEDC